MRLVLHVDYPSGTAPLGGEREGRDTAYAHGCPMRLTVSSGVTLGVGTNAGVGEVRGRQATVWEAAERLVVVGLVWKGDLQSGKRGFQGLEAWTVRPGPTLCEPVTLGGLV